MPPSSATTGIAFEVVRGSMARNPASASMVSMPGVEISSTGASAGSSGRATREVAISTLAA